jgi:hypothetical protein
MKTGAWAKQVQMAAGLTSAAHAAKKTDGNAWQRARRAQKMQAATRGSESTQAAAG